MIRPKIRKFFQISLALILLAPIVSSSGTVLAANSSYYVRNPKTGEVPILPTTATGKYFNRPVYQNNPAANDGYLGSGNSTFANTMVNRDSTADLPDAKTFIENQADPGAYLREYTDSKKTYKNPKMELLYTFTNDTISKKIVGIKYKDYFKPVGSTYNFGKVTNIPAFLADVNNYNVDYNTDGQLELQYRYSVVLDDSLITHILGIPNADKLIASIKKNGLDFNAFVRVPDGYKSSTIVDAVIGKDKATRYSQLFINPTESSIQHGAKWQNTDPGFEVAPVGVNDVYKPLQPVDDHVLKFSINSATNDSYKTIVEKWINDNIGAGLSFLRMIKGDVPIQLQMLLNMNKMSADGDQFDPTTNSILTKGRKLPAIDNKSAINAIFLSSNKLFKVQVATNKYAYFPVHNQNDITKYNNSVPSDRAFMKKVPPLVMPEYLSGNGFSDNAHAILQNESIFNNESTVTNGSSYDMSQEFNPAYMNINNGNAFETWNQYISLYDTQDKYNDNNDQNEIVNMGTTAAPNHTTANLPGSYGLDRNATIRTADVDVNDKFDPMRFYRSVNYFSKLNTTATTKNNATFAEIDANGKPVRVNDNRVEISPGQTKTIWYYGTDENGHPFSPAKLTLTRAKFEYNGTSQVKLRDAADDTFSSEVQVGSGAWLTERNVFTLFDPIGGNPNIKDNVITFKLPVGATIDESQGLQYRAKLGNQVIPQNETTLTKNQDGTYSLKLNATFANPTRPITLDFDYQINGNIGDSINTNKNKIKGANNDPADLLSVTGIVDPVSKINILQPELSLHSVPNVIDFGVNSKPFFETSYYDPEISFLDDSQPGIGINYNSRASEANSLNWNITLKLENSNLPGLLNFKRDENEDWIPVTPSIQTVLSSQDNRLSDGINYLIPKLDFSFDSRPGYQINGEKFQADLIWQLNTGPNS